MRAQRLFRRGECVRYVHSAAVLLLLACNGEATGPATLRTILQLPLTDRIVFQSAKVDTAGDIFAMKLDGSDVVRLTSDVSGSRCPALSPDGKWIAYFRGHSAGAGADSVVLMKANGTEAKVVAAAPWWTVCPLWSPTSQSFVVQNITSYQARSNPDFLFETFGVGGERIGSFTGSGFSHLAFSPDGLHFVYSTNSYTSGGPYDYLIRTMDADGSNSRVLASGNAGAWLDNGELVFACGVLCYGSYSNRGITCRGLCKMAVDGSSQVQLSDIEALPVVSPDGGHIATSCVIQATYIGLCTIDSDGSHFLTLSFSGLRGRPVWASNNRAIAFACVEPHNAPDTRTDICIVNRDGTGLANLTRSAASNRNPGFAPLSSN